ncbi:MAG: Uma2 family endonuclease [Cyanomargarita calcarea GSE-NOS-MK-12-04C]|jgi:Uma2 family endonuclease|uniref:Uma2 family endonuclease n=1 Tax=Cyanomargarita calcarea GSE-NOS-MK-12-04C TaxID=2839659 RepID=A0A951QVD1_9CYAN|nr:Uma2 family endonuclease [Cyanomargarita calcarea GSE-NOS-MK-12-04C]
MTQALPKLVTYEEFIEWFPNDGKRYELHNGVIIEMAPPTGDHEKVVGFLAEKITIEYVGLGLPYRIPKTAFVKTPSAKSTYSPDVLLLNLDNLGNEILFQKQSTVTQAASVPLVVEVVSTNWRDDYHLKFADYEEMGIPEYWIADYAGLGGRDFIGNPKQPAFFVCELVDGEYVKTLFRGNKPIVSPTFPNLNLTAQQIFDAAL